MSDDMNKKIQQIADLLGQESMPDNVKGLLSMLAGSLNNNKEETQEKPVEAENEESITSSEASDTEDLARKVKKVINNINTVNDPRINLLHAIKPFMNNKRQKKISNCIQLLQMSSFAKIFNDNDK